MGSLASNWIYATAPHDGKSGRPSPTAIITKGVVVPQRIEITPSATELEWGDVERATSVSKTITFTNTGNAPFNGMSAAVTGSDGFSISSTSCNVRILPGATCSITIQLRNTSASIVNASSYLKLSPYMVMSTPIPDISLTGRVVDRSFTLSPSSLNHGMQHIKSWNGPYKFNFVNTGNLPLSFTPTVQFATLLANGFDLESGANNCQEVLPGASCFWEYFVKPLSSTSRSYTLQFLPLPGLTSLAKSSAISMQGTPQTYSVETSGLDMGTVTAGTKHAYSVTVTNTSDEALSLTGGADSVASSVNDFVDVSVLSDTCGAMLTAGASCTISAQLAFKNYGYNYDTSSSLSGAITLNWPYAANGNRVFTPKWKMVSPQYEITSDVDPDIGSVPSGAVGKTVTWEFKNVGKSASSFEVSGITAISSTLGYMRSIPARGVECAANVVVQPGDSCYYALTAYPAPGTAAATNATSLLAISLKHGNYNTPNLTPLFSITADITAPSAALDVNVVDFEEVGASTSEVRYIYVTPTHGGVVYLRDSDLSRNSGSAYYTATWATPPDAKYGPAGTMCYSGGRVEDGTYCAIKITFSPPHVASNTSGYTASFRWAVPSGPVLSFTTKALTAAPVVNVVDNGFVWDPVPAYSYGHIRYSLFRNDSPEANVTLTGGTAMTFHQWIPQTASQTFDFKGQTYNGCFSSIQLKPGDYCVAGIRTLAYRATAVGTDPINTNARLSNLNTTYPLTTTYLVPKLEYPEEITFETPIQSTTFDASTDKVIEFKNTGGATLYWRTADNTVTTITVSGQFNIVDNEAIYSSVNTRTSGSAEGKSCTQGAYLPAGTTCTITVRFRPTGAQGARTGKLTFPMAYETVTTSLSATAQAGVVVFSKPSFDFGTVSVDSSATDYITVGNNGTGYLTLSAIARRLGLSATTPGNYLSEMTIEHNCPTILDAGDECTIAATFTPDRNLDFSALSPQETVFFSHTTNAVNNYAFLPLLGKSSGSNLSSSDLEWDIGAFHNGVEVDDTPLKTVTFTASDVSSVTITSLVDNAALNILTDKSTCKAGLRIEVGSSCTLTLKVKPLITSAMLGELTVMNINGNSVDNAGEPLTNGYRKALLKLKGRPEAYFTVSKVSPEVMSWDKATTYQVYGSGFTSETVLEVGGIKHLPSRFITAQLVEFELPAPATKSAIINANVRANRAFGARPYPLSLRYEGLSKRISSEHSADVSTVAEDAPATIKALSSLTAYKLNSGNYLVQNPGIAQYSLVSSTGVTLARLNLSATLSDFYLDGNTLYVATALSGASQVGLPGRTSYVYYGGGYRYYRDFVNALATIKLMKYDLSGNNFLLIRENTIGVGGTIRAYTQAESSAEYDYYSAYLVPQSLTGAIQVLANGSAIANLGISYYYSGYTYNYSEREYTFSRYLPGTASVKTISHLSGQPSAPGILSSSARTSSTLGDAGVMFIRQGDAIFSYTGVGTTFSPDNYVRYTYTGLPTNGGGMAYLPGTKELIVPCENGKAMCGIPTSGRNLGGMSIMAGTQASGDYSYIDGSSGVARFIEGTELRNGGDDYALLYAPYIANQTLRKLAPSTFDQRASFGISEARLDFGDVPLGSKLGNQTLSIGNIGGREGYIVSAYLTNTSGEAFSVGANSCTGAVDTGNYCDIEVRASTAVAGTFTGTITVSTVSSTSTITVPVTLTVKP